MGWLIMPENKLYLPEGSRPTGPYSIEDLKAAKASGTILEGVVTRCDAQHNLHVSLGGKCTGIIPRDQAVLPAISGADREIAVLSRVGKPVCFTVTSIEANEKGDAVVTLSRRMAQKQALEYLMDTLEPGMVIDARVTHLERFGAFVDIGCGIVSLLPIERISISRISHPAERFHQGQKIRAVVLSKDLAHQRFQLSHRELLGSWMENASHFAEGETVRGIVRSVKEYGIFVELLPNLSGLSDLKEGFAPGDCVSVFIKSIQPERMKIKLQILEKLPPFFPPLSYQITDGQISLWRYSPPIFLKDPVETDFTACP